MSLETRLQLSIIQNELLRLAEAASAVDARVLRYAARVLGLVR